MKVGDAGGVGSWWSLSAPREAAFSEMSHKQHLRMKPLSSPIVRHWDLAHRTRGDTAAISTAGWAMDPHEMVVKNPYAHVSIPRAHLRPDLGQRLETAPPSWGSQPLPVGSCTSEPTGLLQPSEEAPGSKGAKGTTQVQGQQSWQQPCNPYSGGQRPAGLTYAGLPPIGRGDDIAHHCCCCPCCSCCHCPRFCRCHSCCCVIS
ncbi:cysteine-rich tail protein 1 [Panthera pardus]|nr:cysteine-rich tail protein 1 [Panthera pardus]